MMGNSRGSSIGGILGMWLRLGCEVVGVVVGNRL